MCFLQAKNTFEKTLKTMIKESKRLVDQPHSFGAVLRCAFLLILFALGVEIHAQSYNLSESYRVSGTTQSTASVSQSGGYGVSVSGNHMSSRIGTPVSEYKMYQGTVYEPFSNALPSDNGDASGITNRRNAFVDRPDDKPAQGSPIGEPWVLLLFAAAAAIVVAWRRRKVA